VLRAYALRMMSTGEDRDEWPDMVLFLGDQVYADETSDAMQEYIAARRSLDEPPGEELKNYTEYAHLYALAWSDPANRWLLSTLPSAMIFDDHDIRDDWNTSQSWREDIERTEWWHDRIVGGLASYWVYQHLGNLTPPNAPTTRCGSTSCSSASSVRTTSPWRSTSSRNVPTSAPSRTGGASRASTRARGWSWWTPVPRGS
jgi:hypothetical protein